MTVGKRHARRETLRSGGVFINDREVIQLPISVCECCPSLGYTLGVRKALHLLSKPLQEDYRIIGYPGVRLRRSAAALFGIASRGAHMTAYVREPDGLYIWVSRRNRHLFTYPGMLDTTVAGGVKAEQSPLECIIQEAEAVNM